MKGGRRYWFVPLAVLLVLAGLLIGASRSDLAAYNDPSTAGPTTLPTVTAPLPTFDELLAKHPDLRTYYDKIAGLTASQLDLTELYVNVIALYKSDGATAVDVFTRDSGLLNTLHIPPSYLDLLNVYDQSGIAGLLITAKQRQIINNQGELSGYIQIDQTGDTPANNHDTVSKALQSLGLSTYRYDPARSELEIGIPVDSLLQFSSPGALMSFMTQIAQTPHIVGFRLPTPALSATPTG